MFNLINDMLFNTLQGCVVIILGSIPLTLMCTIANGTTSDVEKVRFPAPWTSTYRVDPQNQHHLINDDGNHLFIVCRTAWAYFGCEKPAAFLDRTSKLGCNVIRVALEGRPYYNKIGIDLWPWAGSRSSPDYDQFDMRYWDEVERRIRLAGEKGIGIDLVLYFSLKPEVDDVLIQRRYWQHIIDRLSKYSNILCWEIHNEYIGNEVFQDQAGAFFQQSDPFHRPVCTSTGTTDDAIWPEKPWISLAINHSCTGSGAAGGMDHSGRHLLDAWYLTVARKTRSHGKPAWCNESGREKRHKNDDGIHRRKQGWLWTTAGCFWTWHSWDGCEGINEAHYAAPGAEYVPMYLRFWSAQEFWRLSPDNTTAVPNGENIIWTALSTKYYRNIILYLCMERSGAQVVTSSIEFRLPAGLYAIQFIQPQDLQMIGKEMIKSDGSSITTLALPKWTDDLLVIARNQEIKPSTGVPDVPD